MKAYRLTEKRYYKYVYKNWQQPVLSEDGIIGGDSFAVWCSGAQSYAPAYMAFDNDPATRYYSYPAGLPRDLVFYNPNPLNVTKLVITNVNNTNPKVTGYTIYGSNDNSDWVELTSGTNDNTTAGASWDIDLSSNPKYYKFYMFRTTKCWTGGNAYAVIAEMTITATEKTVQESTEDDYDFYIASGACMIPKIRERIYYKNIETPWEQPMLTQNGVLGGEYMAVSSNPERSNYPAYKAFNTNDTGFWGPTDSHVPVELIIYTPNAIKVSSLYYVVQDNNRRPTDWEWYGSNDNLEYTLLASGTNDLNTFTLNFDYTGHYNYHKFNILTNNNGVNAKEITLTATYQEAIESTKDDYDFYKDVDAYKAFLT